jgi:shikimate dehydrogenase
MKLIKQTARILEVSPFYAVLGNPIAHSKSPMIQQQFAQSLGMTLRYERVRVPLNSFAYTLKSLAQQGLQGCNVTVPFKLAAFEAADVCSERAQTAQAVNCLKRQSDGTWLADNTDGTGLVADLKRLRGGASSLQGTRVLVLGAGGAVQGSVAPLLAAGAVVHIANRTPDKAKAVAALFGSAVTGHSLQEDMPQCDIVINGTSASLQALAVQPNPGAIGAHTLAYDMMYAAQPTAFMRLCQAQGARTADGLGMLIEQAAESFNIWHGIMPDTLAVHQALGALR